MVTSAGAAAVLFCSGCLMAVWEFNFNQCLHKPRRGNPRDYVVMKSGRVCNDFTHQVKYMERRVLVETTDLELLQLDFHFPKRQDTIGGESLCKLTFDVHAHNNNNKLENLLAAIFWRFSLASGIV